MPHIQEVMNKFALPGGYKTPNLWSDKRCNLWQPSICEVPNPHYNGSEALEFSHDISKYIDESLCLVRRVNRNVTP